MSKTAKVPSTVRPQDGTDRSVGALSEGGVSFQYDNKDQGPNNNKVPLLQLAAFALAVLAALGSGLGVGVVINKNKKPPATAAPTTPVPTTYAPTEVPIPPEVQLLDEILPDYTLASIREDPQRSPQARAYRWFLEELEADDAMLKLPVGRLQQRYALATWYFSTNGDQWYQNDGWLNHSLHECLWFNKPWFSAVPYEGFDARFWTNDNYNACEWPTLDPNVTYDYLYTFRHFWHHENNLGGSIPRQIGLLTGLVSTYMFNNFYGGPLPSQIGLLKELRVLNFGVNQVTGTLPTELGSMYSLRGISVFGTNIEGTIPSQLGLLTKLSTLKIDENRLTGTIPTTLGLAPVHEFWLSRNQLTGPVPSQLGLLKPLDRRGSDFLLFANLLTGTIPTQLGGSFTNRLDLFWLHQNQLTGSLPTQIGLMAGTKDLNLGDNRLTGTLPTQLGLCTSAFRLDLHNNKLEGTIPSQLGLHASLFFLELYENRLTGTIPQQLPNLAPVTPSWIASSSNGLRWFQDLRVDYDPYPPLVFAVQNNQLSGTIPPNFSLVENLGALQLTNNPLLSGTLPEELCNTTVWPLYKETRAFDCTSLLCGCDCVCSSNQTL